jgi:transcriptional regulator CtsR
MSILSDSIENFIKALMQEENESNQVEVRRNELAEYFHCAPSQINYVLTTRFSPDRGYYTQSRRGGGGYIRIIRVEHEDDSHYMLHLIHQRIGDELSQPTALDIIKYMMDHKIVSPREATLMMAALTDRAINIPIQNKDRIRANLLKEMVTSLIAQQAQEGE